MRSILLILALGGSLFGAGSLIGRRAPGFSLPDRNFTYHDPQDYRGKILIVEFMQTTCPHCEVFSKILQEALSKYGGKVAVISIVNPPDAPDKVARYVAVNKLTYPVLFDTGQIALSYIQWAPGKSLAFDLPRLFVIDAAGIVRLDLEYSILTKEVFEGRGLFAELDKLMQAQPGSAKK